MNRSKPAPFAAAIVAAAAFLSLPVALSAQKTTTTTSTPQGITKEVTIDTAVVVYASGDDAVIKLPDGRLRLFEVTPGTTFEIDGKPATVADLKVGTTITHVKMKSRQESEITDVTQFSGRITRRSGPFLTLRLDDGTSKIYRVPANATFTVDGREAKLADLRRGSSVQVTAVRTHGLSTVTTSSAKTGVHPQTPQQVGTLVIETNQTPAKE
jgi:Cu/Ag efflux protein CusF